MHLRINYLSHPCSTHGLSVSGFLPLLLSAASVSAETRISCMFVCDWPGLNPPPTHQAVRASRRSEMSTSRPLKGSLPALHDGSLRSPLSCSYISSLCFPSSLFTLSCMSFACCCVPLPFLPSLPAHYPQTKPSSFSLIFSMFLRVLNWTGEGLQSSLSQALPLLLLL